MNLKYKLSLIIFSVTILGSQLVVSAPVSAAISEKEQAACHKKYAGHGTGSSTDGKFNSKLSAEYKKSKCDTSKGGNCNLNTSGPQGVIVRCTNPDKPDDGGQSKQDNDQGGSGSNVDCEGEFSSLDENNCGILKMIKLITNVLSGIAGVVIVAMIIAGGIQYSMSGSDPSKVQAAKQKIINAMLALLLLVFGFSLLQWLIPGGIF